MALPFPVDGLTLFLTEKCNLDCSYCHFRKSTKTLDFSKCKPAIEGLLKTGGGNKRITFFGGEPLLEFGLLKKIVYYANKLAGGRKIEYILNTNGTILNHAILGFLKKNNFRVVVGADGNEHSQGLCRKSLDGKNSFDQMKKGLRLFKKISDSVQINIAIHPSNTESIKSNIKFFIDWGFKNYRLSPVYDALWGGKQNRMLYSNILGLKGLVKEYNLNLVNIKEKKEAILNNDKSLNSCNTIKNSVAVSADGEVYPCVFFISMRQVTRKRHLLGKELKKINEAKRQKYIKYHRENSSCKSCKYHEYCRPLCQAYSFLSDKKKYSNMFSVNCSFQKAIIDLTQKLYKPT